MLLASVAIKKKPQKGSQCTFSSWFQCQSHKSYPQHEEIGPQASGKDANFIKYPLYSSHLTSSLVQLISQKLACHILNIELIQISGYRERLSIRDYRIDQNGFRVELRTYKCSHLSKLGITVRKENVYDRVEVWLKVDEATEMQSGFLSQHQFMMSLSS